MGRIITVNRQFGSGGREFGKRLAENLGIAYYDNEIIREIAGRSGMATDYVNRIVERKPLVYYPITIGRTFVSYAPHALDFNTKIYTEQHNIIKELAAKSDCVIIGRCADYILREISPLRIFIHAEMPARMARCREKAPEGETMTDKQLIKHIEGIDSERSEYYRYFTGQKWEDFSHYDLCLNTSRSLIKDLAEGLAEYIKKH